jgi:hypothetical protein
MGKNVVHITKNQLKEAVRFLAEDGAEAPDDMEIVGVQYLANQDLLLLVVQSETFSDELRFGGTAPVLDCPDWWWRSKP